MKIKKIIGVDAIIRDKKGYFLFQKKTMNAPHSAGKLCLFGGGVEKGEENNELKTLKRELIEEIEYEIRDTANISFIDYIEYNENYGNLSAIYFIDNIDSDNLVLHEGEEIVYFETFDKVLNSNNLREKLLDFLKKNKNKIIK